MKLIRKVLIMSIIINSVVGAEEYSDRNRLAGSNSPYLLQHASNPVHWVPWGDEALEEARRLDKPLLVSIGYSTCHWCHVMAHESFEDEETAKLMNENFVNVKVDREELPGVDAYFMEAAALMGVSTGWPLNVFIDPQGNAFYGGTYFTNQQWKVLINELSQHWETNKGAVIKTGERLTAAMERIAQSSRGDVFISNLPALEPLIDKAQEELMKGYNQENPGFPSPQGAQFPPTLALSFMMEQGRRLDRVEAILTAMQDSGLHDRVGGGFHRYTVDVQWRVPHFEKMLYDNAQLMGLYARGAVLFDREDFLTTARGIGDYLLRDMRVNFRGNFQGYATAEDADDPGGEGSFYAWGPEMIREALSPEKAEKIIRQWDLKVTPRRGHGPLEGSIPHPRGAQGYNPGEIGFTLDEWRDIQSQLLMVRSDRPRPGRDSKVLTDLNGLTLEGFSQLARVTGDVAYVNAARELADLLISQTRDGIISRTRGIEGYITDYGFLLLGFTAAYPLLEDPALIEASVLVGQLAVENLATSRGSFYSSQEGSTGLPVRRIDPYDGQIPSGQSALALGFSRLYGITGNKEYFQRVREIIDSQDQSYQGHPHYLTTLLRAQALLETPWHIVLAGGGPGYDDLKGELLKVVGPEYLVISAQGGGDWPILENRRDLGSPQVLICNDTSCLLPAYSVEQVLGRLRTAGIINLD